MRILLSLCDYSGVWSLPFAQNGWKVIQVDTGFSSEYHSSASGMVEYVRADVTRIRNGHILSALELRPDAVLAAPPCTCFCRPGARWWKQMDAEGKTERDIEVFRACLNICRTAKLWWALENPPGRHRKLIPELGDPAWQFRPYEYGDPWDKQTYIWGTAVKPEPRNQVEPPKTIRTPNGHTQGTIARMSSSWKREREKTPPGFAQAFCEAQLGVCAPV